MFENYGTDGLLQKRKTNQQGEYNTILNEEMKQIFLKYLLHPNKFSIGKAINLTKHILEKRGYENIPCNITFRRFAENFKKNNYSKWILFREGKKAYHDKIEPYIERDISKIEVGEVLIADGHVLNFQIINPFTGKPTRATLVGFLDWKSTALVGYEIMMSENTQCIASALRNSILNLGVVPKVVYQDNGKAFKAKYFQNIDFDEAGFNGIYAKLGIKSVFAKPYNARAKVIERFFLEFQEEFEKMMTNYIGTSIENKPAWMKRGEKLHKDMHNKLTKNYIPTIRETINFIDCWLDYHNSKPCPNNRSKTIQEMLNDIQKRRRAEGESDSDTRLARAPKQQDMDKSILNDLMMKTETRTINKHGITFLGMHYRSDYLLDLREKVFIKYSLFDLSKVLVYSIKGEFLCIARQVEKVHPMANHLGTVKDSKLSVQKYSIFKTYPATINDIVLRCFCENINSIKASNIANIGENQIQSFYTIFRTLIYQRQKQNLDFYYLKSPQKARHRKFFNQEVYLYLYCNQIFVSENLLKSSEDKTFSKDQKSKFTTIYCYLSRNLTHNKMATNLNYKIAETLWRRKREFKDLYYDLKLLAGF